MAQRFRCHARPARSKPGAGVMLSLGFGPAVFFAMPFPADSTLRDILHEACIDMHGALARTNPQLKTFLVQHYPSKRLCGFGCARGRPPVLLQPDLPLQAHLGQGLVCVAFSLDEGESESESAEGTSTDCESDTLTDCAPMDWETAYTVEGVTWQMDRLSLS